jgi:hypothetical protein
LYIISTGGGTACCYSPIQFSDGNDCKQCLDGADCSVIGSILTTLQLHSGYWRASHITTDVRECWLAEACVGINNPSTTTSTTATATRRRRATETASIGQSDANEVTDIYCADGYKGPCKYTQIAIFVKCASAFI